MTPVSNKKLPGGTRVLLESALLHSLSNLSPRELKKVLNTLLTKTERMMLYKRIGIVYLLNENVFDSDIAEAVRTTRQTVARISLRLRTVPKETLEFVTNKLISWKRVNTLRGLVRSILDTPLNPIRRKPQY